MTHPHRVRPHDVPPHGGQPVLEAGAPVDLAAAAVILVHGRNASPRNIIELANRFDRADVAYLAPAAAGGTWYPQSFLAPIAANEPGLSSGIAVLAALVDELDASGVSADRIVIAGFSQGACLASEFAARHARRFGGLVIFTGGVVGPDGTPREYSGRFDGTPVFLGSSDVDAHVPQARVEETAALFSRMGANVDLRIYQGMGHLVNDDEIARAQRVIDLARGARDGRDRDRLKSLVAEHGKRGDALSAFDQFYREAGRDASRIPWSDNVPNPQLVTWVTRTAPDLRGVPTLVVGCGLGEDAEYLASLGARVTAFDLSPTAVAWCRERYPHSAVDYRVGDLLDTPAEWRGRFDLIFEANTLQVLPGDLISRGMAAIVGLLSSGGRLVVVCRAREEDESADGPPWPLTRARLAEFERLGLRLVSLDDMRDQSSPPTRRFLAYFLKP